MIFIHFQRTDNEEVNLLKDRRGKFPPKFDKAKKKDTYICVYENLLKTIGSVGRISIKKNFFFVFFFNLLFVHYHLCNFCIILTVSTTLSTAINDITPCFSLINR